MSEFKKFPKIYQLGSEEVDDFMKYDSDKIVIEENVFDLIPESKYYDGKAEGIVLKNYSRKSQQGNYQLFAKVVCEQFKEDNRATFGGIKKPNSDTQKIVDEFCTQARVYKSINKLVQEEGNPLQMELMKYLPRLVVKDILSEEILNIQSTYNWLDFKSMNKLVCVKCVKYLQGYMVNKNE